MLKQCHIGRFIKTSLSTLDKTNLDLDQISYADAVPFRYKGKPQVPVFEIAYNNFTENLINLYKPHQIVPLGTGDEMLIKGFAIKKQLKILRSQMA